MNFNEAIRIFNANRSLRVKSPHVNGQDRDLRNFAVFMKNCEIESVTDEHIVEWIGLFKTMGYAVGTLIKKEEALIQFYKFFGRKGFDVVDHMLIPLTDKEYAKPKVCSEEKYHKLLGVVPIEGKLGTGSNTFDIRNRAIFSFLWNTGMRIGELISLNLSDLDVDKKLITIKTEKSKGVRPFRVLPYDIMDDEAVKVMPLWLEAREKIVREKPLLEPDTLFFGYKTTKNYGNRFAVSALGEIFAKTSKKAGLEVDEYVNAHSLRHHYGHALARRNMNNSIISEAMGHAQVSSSYRYTQLEAGDLVDALRVKVLT